MHNLRHSSPRPSVKCQSQHLSPNFDLCFLFKCRVGRLGAGFVHCNAGFGALPCRVFSPKILKNSKKCTPSCAWKNACLSLEQNKWKQTKWTANLRDFPNRGIPRFSGKVLICESCCPLQGSFEFWAPSTIPPFATPCLPALDRPNPYAHIWWTLSEIPALSLSWESAGDSAFIQHREGQLWWTRSCALSWILHEQWALSCDLEHYRIMTCLTRQLVRNPRDIKLK